MSAIGALLARALGALGGPATGAAIVTAGIVAGGVGGGLLATGGTGQAAGAQGRLPVYACPDAGEPIAVVEGGQRLLATGRTEDGGWLRIHFPDPGRSEAWVQAGPLEVKGATADLPVATCAAVAEVPGPSVSPGPSLTAIVNLPDPTPSPTIAPTPTATPVDRDPRITALTVSSAKISHDTGDYCPNAETTARFTVKATDDVGLSAVTLFWRPPGAGSFRQAAMSRTSGSETRGTWQVSLDTDGDNLSTAGRLAYYAVATDTAGATRRLPNRGSDSISVAVCENEGPEITKVASLSGSKLSWDPLGAGGCQTATNITAVIKDVDGVRSATLFYRRPGQNGWSQKAMNDQTIKGRWYANLDSLGDNITIPNPPTATLRWYIRAVDDTGKASQTSTREMTIRRCDWEAKFGYQSTYPVNVCAQQDTWFYGSASDPDGIGARSAELVYRYRLTDGSYRTGRKAMQGDEDGDWYYSAPLRQGKNWAQGRVFLEWHIETVDRFGGRSKSQTSQVLVSSSC